jgi:hypothetical protein
MNHPLDAAKPWPVSSFHFHPAVDSVSGGADSHISSLLSVSWAAPFFFYIAASTLPYLLDSPSRSYLDCCTPPSFIFMLATAAFHDPTMRDLEQELKATLAGLHTSDGGPREGLHVLTRRMENEEEEQFDVDLTILDFLVYKATGLVFEWKSSADPYHSDLPSALVTMTGGATMP